MDARELIIQKKNTNSLCVCVSRVLVVSHHGDDSSYKDIFLRNHASFKRTLRIRFLATLFESSLSCGFDTEFKTPF